MSTALQTRAEIAKLARLLGRGPEQFEYLQECDPAELRALREQTTELLFIPFSSSDCVGSRTSCSLWTGAPCAG